MFAIENLVRDSEVGWMLTDPVQVPMFNTRWAFALDNYYPRSKTEFEQVIDNFLQLQSDDLAAANSFIFQYYQDTLEDLDADEIAELTPIDSAEQVRQFIELAGNPLVQRRDADGLLYVSLDFKCDWNADHGLQIVFREGKALCKVGEYDSHLTNSDAYDDAAFEDRIYVPMSEL